MRGRGDPWQRGHKKPSPSNNLIEAGAEMAGPDRLTWGGDRTFGVGGSWSGPNSRLEIVSRNCSCRLFTLCCTQPHFVAQLAGGGATFRKLGVC